MKTTNLSISVMAIFFVLTFCGLAQASIAMMKVYKEAYPDAKPKCIDCHLSDKPKKDADHELNAYGKKVTEISEKPTAEDYKKAGTVEDFNKK